MTYARRIGEANKGEGTAPLGGFVLRSSVGVVVLCADHVGLYDCMRASDTQEFVLGRVHLRLGIPVPKPGVWYGFISPCGMNMDARIGFGFPGTHSRPAESFEFRGTRNHDPGRHLWCWANFSIVEDCLGDEPSKVLES